MVGVHTWCDKNGGPVGYVLANTLVQSGSGANQAAVDEHVLREIYGISGVCGVVGDNASTQSGNKKGHAAELGSRFKSNTVFIPCYPHILNIALRNAMVEGFGQRGGMLSFNLFQLHYKVGYVHHQRPTYYKSLCVSEGILPTAPPLPQEFVETRWTYIHASLQWWSKYGKSCVKLGQRILQFLPKKESHFSIWEDIIRMAANEVLAVERTALLELLDRLIMPGLKKSQEGDPELNFSSGYLARMWPAQVLSDTHMAHLMRGFDDFAMPLTAQAKGKLDKETAAHFTANVQAPMLDAVIATFTKHSTRWLRFPLLFAMGADTTRRNLFWRAVLRISSAPVEICSFTHGTPPEMQDITYIDLIELSLSLKCPEKLAGACFERQLLDQQSFLLGQSSAAWFDEFLMLTLVAQHADDFRTWLAHWPLSSEAMSEARMIAADTSPSVPNKENEPHLWQWFATYVFAMPVNNVIAERQFNIASIYLHPNESELSKQASHLFVENVLHSTPSRLELYRSMSAPSRKSVRVTYKFMDHVAQQMNEYAATITSQRVKEARDQVKRLRSSQSTARTSTAAETYSTISTRHRQRPSAQHDQRMATLEEEGKLHGVAHEPGSRKPAEVQQRAVTRSFPPRTSSTPDAELECTEETH